VGAALALLAAIIAFLLFFDWNWLRGPIGRYASAQLKREVVITGDLRVHPWSLSPKVEAYGLRIGQPSWTRQLESSAAPMAQVQRVAVQIKLLPLLRGQTVLPFLAIDRPDLRLLRAKDGRANWTFGTARSDKPLKLPIVQRLIVNDGALRVDDRQRGGDIDLLLETELRDPAQIVAAHSRFLADAYAQLGEQKIDLLIDYPGRTNRAPIFERARSQGQLL